VYAPQICIRRNEKTHSGKNNKALEKKSNKNEISLVGNFNARVGKEERDQAVGRFGKEEVNNNGERLRETCDYRNLK
jgi:hypothetical protein